jgi:hypothetical protein
MTFPGVPSFLTQQLADDLSLEDFKSCRELLVENIRIMERNETAVVAAVGATITFGVASADPLFTAHLVILPTIIVLGYLRFLGLRHVIHLADEFTLKIEANLPIGWATYYRAKSTGLLGRSRHAFWGVLALLAMFYLGFCIRCGPFPHK